MKQVYVHGLGQTSECWEKTIFQLGNKKNALCPDLASMIRGKKVNYVSLYQAFSNYCNQIEGSIDLCGLSLGGVMALNFAIDHPEKVNSLALIAVQYKMPKKLLQFQNLLFRFMPKSMFEEMGFGKDDFLQLCKSMMELDFSESVRKIACPTMVICGEKDNANKKASMELADILQNAELQIVSGAGHELNTDTPEKLSEILKEFDKQIQ